MSKLETYDGLKLEYLRASTCTMFVSVALQA